MIFWGHSENGSVDGAGIPEMLRDHVEAVTDRSENFANAFGCGPQARVAGSLHDLGKYADQFQERVRGRGAGRDHASAGAYVALRLYKKLALVPAMAIAAHHSGLAMFEFRHDAFAKSLSDRLRTDGTCTSGDVGLLQQRSIADRIAVPPRFAGGLTPTGEFVASDMLDVRMLFSCLVDADFLETEAHFDGDAKTPRRPRPVGPSLRIDEAIAALDRRIAQFDPPANPLQQTRGDLLAACVRAAAQPAGLFSLTAPTGSGKTLAMLAFALHHARAHGLRRIVLVMPFLNIIDQTATLYRNIFDELLKAEPHIVLEHHSLIRDGDEQKKIEEEPPDDEANVAVGKRKPALHRLLAENWDAPIILTTSVQCLESMMSHKPSACRKLHRLAGSVILFDEVQTLPPKLAKATLATLSRLADPAGPFRSSVLFATATQPAFEVLHGQVATLCASGWQPREINVGAPRMFKVAGERIRVRWHHREPIGIDALAEELAGHDQVLAIVNLKRHAIALLNALRDRTNDESSVLHLSTNMCPAHRLAALKTIRDRHDRGRPMRVVSTQCVEAGVDLDFAHVYRALAPLDAICQAAGRCNRHGTRATPGFVTVFRLEADGTTEFPPGYREGLDATQNWLDAIAKDHCLDAIDLLNDPQRIAAYFKLLYGASGRDRGEHNDERALMSALAAGDFADVARECRLIDQNSISILVPYDRAAFTRLRRESEGFADGEARRRWRQEATHHAVSVIRPKIDSPLWPHLEAVDFFAGRETDNAEADWFVALDGVSYDPLVGLVIPESPFLSSY